MSIRATICGCGMGLLSVLGGGCAERLPLQPYEQPVRPSRWTVSPSPVQMLVGDTVRFYITVFGPDGDTLDIRPGRRILGQLGMVLIAPYLLQPAGDAFLIDSLKSMIVPLRAIQSGDAQVFFSWGYHDCVRDGSDLRCSIDGPWVDVLGPVIVPVQVR